MITKKQLIKQIESLKYENNDLKNQIENTTHTDRYCPKCIHAIEITTRNGLFPVTTYECELNCKCKYFIRNDDDETD